MYGSQSQAGFFFKILELQKKISRNSRKILKVETNSGNILAEFWSLKKFLKNLKKVLELKQELEKIVKKF